jgi:hypothetical protein
MCFLVVWFAAVAIVAVLYVSVHILPHDVIQMISGYQVEGVCSSLVSFCKGVMVFFQQVWWFLISYGLGLRGVCAGSFTAAVWAFLVYILNAIPHYISLTWSASRVKFLAYDSIIHQCICLSRFSVLNMIFWVFSTPTFRGMSPGILVSASGLLALFTWSIYNHIFESWQEIWPSSLPLVE